MKKISTKYLLYLMVSIVAVNYYYIDHFKKDFFEQYGHSVPVIIAKKDILIGEKFTQENLRMIALPLSFIISSRLTRFDSIIGKVNLHPIYQGQ